jgi:rhomboid protease GluP
MVERISLLPWMHRGWREAPVTVILMAINVIVFGIMAFASGDVMHLTPGISLDWGANFGPATEEGEWWRLLTAVFIHLSLLHVAINLWAIWDIGRLIEGILGAWRYILLFIGSGVVGNLISLALQNHQRISSGSSGAIFGLYGALIIFLWRQRTRIVLDEYRWIFAFAIAFSVVMLSVGFFIPSIDNAAHGGGLLAGLVLGTLLGQRAFGSAQSISPTVLSPAGLLSAITLLVIFVNLPKPSYRYSEERLARQAIDTFVIQDRLLTQRWRALLAAESQQPFDYFSETIDREIAAPYQRSFEALSKVEVTGNVPSLPVLLQLQSYADRRRTEALQSVRDADRDRLAPK